jgi:hypothetical protein
METGGRPLIPKATLGGHPRARMAFRSAAFCRKSASSMCKCYFQEILCRLGVPGALTYHNRQQSHACLSQAGKGGLWAPGCDIKLSLLLRDAAACAGLKTNGLINV